jgi:hypothetical protein
MPDDGKDVKVDWTITHGEPDELRATVGDQQQARREDEARRPAPPARERRGPGRPIGNTDAPVNPGDGGEDA